ncbi:MAG: segregation/condensation protein A [bacterium]
MTLDPRVEIQGFGGTLDELITAVRRHELDILEILLSDVAAQTRREVLASDDPAFEPFMKISGLMFVKSRTLLPTEILSMEDELLEESGEIVPAEEPTSVRERLEEQYRLFSGLREHFLELADLQRDRLHFSLTRQPRPRFMDEIEYVELVTPFDLLAVYHRALRRALEDDSYRVSTDEAHLLSRRITEVFDFVFQRGEKTPFSLILSSVRRKRDAVLSFLAVVFLVASGKISARQKRPFGEIYLYPAPEEEE